MLNDIPQGALWLPGVGVSGTQERVVAKVVEDYDPDFVLGQRKDTEEWIIFSKRSGKFNDGEPFPILGLGRTLPGPDEVQRKMYNADVRRHGEKIFTQLHRRNDERLKAARKLSNDKLDVAVDAFVHGFRKEGVHPSPRIFVPRSI